MNLYDLFFGENTAHKKLSKPSHGLPLATGRVSVKVNNSNDKNILELVLQITFMPTGVPIKGMESSVFGFVKSALLFLQLPKGIYLREFEHNVSGTHINLLASNDVENRTWLRVNCAEDEQYLSGQLEIDGKRNFTIGHLEVVDKEFVDIDTKLGFAELNIAEFVFVRDGKLIGDLLEIEKLKQILIRQYSHDNAGTYYLVKSCKLRLDRFSGDD